MKEELKKSLRTYGALLLLGVTGVPMGAAVGLIEALFCRLLLKVTAIRVAHLFWCLPFLAVAGLWLKVDASRRQSDPRKVFKGILSMVRLRSKSCRGNREG